jgi:mono/diheme cytochrome c family protein
MPGLLPPRAGVVLIALFAAVHPGGAQDAQRKADAGGVPAPTPELERGRAVYVLSSCHFCHGVDLTGAQMGATDLMHSPLIAADQNGNFIGPVVRAGKPNLQTAMPSYPDLTSEEIENLAAYIHYLRRQGRYRELTMEAEEQGDARAGEMYFNANCASCHSRSGDLAGISRRYVGRALRARLLRPTDDPALSGSDRVAAGRLQHGKLLERYTPSDVRNLIAFLREPLATDK